MGKVYDYPFSDQNGAKTLPDGAARTYMAFIKEYPPPPRAVSLLELRDALYSPAPQK